MSATFKELFCEQFPELKAIAIKLAGKLPFPKQLQQTITNNFQIASENEYWKLLQIESDRWDRSWLAIEQILNVPILKDIEIQAEHCPYITALCIGQSSKTRDICKTSQNVWLAMLAKHFSQHGFQEWTPSEMELLRNGPELPIEIAAKICSLLKNHHDKANFAQSSKFFNLAERELYRRYSRLCYNNSTTTTRIIGRALTNMAGINIISGNIINVVVTAAVSLARSGKTCIIYTLKSKVKRLYKKIANYTAAVSCDISDKDVKIYVLSFNGEHNGRFRQYIRQFRRFNQPTTPLPGYRAERIDQPIVIVDELPNSVEKLVWSHLFSNKQTQFVIVSNKADNLIKNIYEKISQRLHYNLGSIEDDHTVIVINVNPMSTMSIKTRVKKTSIPYNVVQQKPTIKLLNYSISDLPQRKKRILHQCTFNIFQTLYHIDKYLKKYSGCWIVVMPSEPDLTKRDIAKFSTKNTNFFIDGKIIQMNTLLDIYKDRFIINHSQHDCEKFYTESAVKQKMFITSYLKGIDDFLLTACQGILLVDPQQIQPTIVNNIITKATSNNSGSELVALSTNINDIKALYHHRYECIEE